MDCDLLDERLLTTVPDNEIDRDFRVLMAEAPTPRSLFLEDNNEVLKDCLRGVPEGDDGADITTGLAEPGMGLVGEWIRNPAICVS